jgi:DNA-binding LytR/AlgR family response regulator
MTENETFQLKERLYMLEEMLDDSFLKINQSCIANIHKIKKFDASFSGALFVTLQNGYKDYVSRRRLKAVKERIGL